MQNRMAVDRNVGLLTALLSPSTKHLGFVDLEERVLWNVLREQAQQPAKTNVIVTEEVTQVDNDSSDGTTATDAADAPPVPDVTSEGPGSSWLADIISTDIAQPDSGFTDVERARQEMDRYMAEEPANEPPLVWWKAN